MGIALPRPPQVDKSRTEALVDLWRQARLQAIETRDITVHRTFSEFDDFWNINLKGATVGPAIAVMGRGDALALKERVRKRLSADGEGRITYGAPANAIKGRIVATAQPARLRYSAGFSH